MKYKAIFFDLDDTLCDDSAAWVTCADKAAQLAAGRIGSIDTHELATVFLDISERYWTSTDWMSETRSIYDLRLEQWSQALASLGLDRDEELAGRMASDYGGRRSRDIELFPDAVPTLKRLREMGCCLALITNGLAATHTEKVEHLGIEALVDHVLIADVIGHFKPDARIFHHALDLCSISANEALMVGDDLKNDIAGAEDVGIQSVWFNPSRRVRPDGAAVPSGGEIGRISDLLDLLPTI